MGNAQSFVGRFALIGVILVLTVASFAYVGGWLSRTRLTPTRMIGALEGAGGVHPGFRRNHAKGLCFTGWFDSNGEGAALSKASLLAAGRTPLTGRFALAGGTPMQIDKPATVRSMALRFVPADGAEWRTGMNNIPVFVVNSAAAFQEQIIASKLDPATGKPDPDAMKQFLSRHPESAKAVALIKAHPPSSGFAADTFNSLDAFRFINAAGTSVPVRWAMVPLQPAVIQAYSPDDDAAPPAAGKNSLFDDLIAQVHEKPLQWRLVITIGDASDATSDATVPWPATRRRVDVGVVSVDKVSGEDGGACTDINFDPLILPPGMEASDDPLLSARLSVYARSYALRSRERATKPPSAVSMQEAQGVSR